MKKLTLFLLAALSLSAQAFGQAARFDGVAQSTRLVNGITLTIPLPSATITVYNFGTTTKASVCPDITATSCTSTTPNNPVTSDAQGNFGFWIPGGVYDYTVTPSSGTVQGPYHAVVPFGVTSGGSPTYGSSFTLTTLLAKYFEAVRYADQFAGADFSAQVNACITDVIAHGGGICDATALDGSQTISSQINVGQSAGTAVVLKLPPNLNAVVTISDGTSCGLKVFDKSAIIGLGAGALKTFIKGTTGTNVDSLVCTEASPSLGGSVIRIEGIEVWNDHNNTGTYVNGMLHIQHLYDGSFFNNIFVRADGVKGLYVHDVCCGTRFESIVSSGFGSAGSQPCVFGKNGEHTGASFVGLSCTHPGDTKNALLINDAGTAYTALQFIDLYTECNTTDTATPLIQINSGSNGTVLIDGISASGPACAGGNTSYLIDIDAAVRGVVFHNVRRFNNQFGTINDHANSITVTATYEPNYSYGGGGYLGSLRSLKIGSGTEFTSQTGSGSALVSDISPSIQTQISITDAAATNRQLNFSTAGVTRWILRANNTAEGGANAGSDFELSARNDSGAILATTIGCTRSTSDCKFAGNISPSSAGGKTAGTNALPFSSAFIGAAATNNAQLTGTFTAARVHTLPDITGNVSVYLSASDAAVDLASVASAACTSERTVAVTGAAFGDAVDVMAGTALEAGGFLTGKVTSSGNIKWQLCNLSGGAIDRASDTYSIRVRK